MGTIKGDAFISSYLGDQIDALLAAMAQANPMPSGTDWIAFIDDCREAQAGAENAQAAAETAQSESENAATLAQSWAIGGTNTRTGENTNNAKYYSQESASSATSANSSASAAANSATAANTSKEAAANSASAAQSAASTAAEQTAAQIRNEMQGIADEAADSATLSESWAVGGTDTRVEEDTNNSKYYCELAQAAAEQASVPPVEGVYNIIVADRVTSDKYALVVYNGRLTMIGVAASTEATDMTLIDATSGTTYSLAVSSGRLQLVEV